jgi:hypothetical protein
MLTAIRGIFTEPPARRTACLWRQFFGKGGLGGVKSLFRKKIPEIFLGIFLPDIFLAMQRKVSGFFLKFFTKNFLNVSHPEMRNRIVGQVVGYTEFTRPGMAGYMTISDGKSGTCPPEGHIFIRLRLTVQTPSGG